MLCFCIANLAHRRIQCEARRVKPPEAQQGRRVRKVSCFCELGESFVGCFGRSVNFLESDNLEAVSL